MSPLSHTYFCYCNFSSNCYFLHNSNVVDGSISTYDKGSFHTFIAVLTGLGVFITFMFYYNLVELQAQQQKLASIQELSRINNTVLSPC